MSRSSLSIWKRVRRAYYQMPDGPEGMSEPQYVSLALDLICDVSFASMTKFFPINERDFRAVESLLITAPCILVGMPSWRAVVNVNRNCELAYWYILSKSKLMPDSLVNESDLNKFDLSRKLPPSLYVLIQGMSYRYSRFSLEQVKIWSQEYASFSASGSSVNLEEWLCPILGKVDNTKEVFSWFLYHLYLRILQRCCLHYLAQEIIRSLDKSTRKGNLSRTWSYK